MINLNLHANAVPLDSTDHRDLKLRLPVTDWSPARGLNTIFVAAVEFGDAAREYPLVFVRAGKEPDGREQIAPIAVLGLQAGQNLYLEGTSWRATYMPAMLRAYPFCIGRLSPEQFAVCMDMAWSGINREEGSPLFEADGQPAELMKAMKEHMEKLESEVQRTRVIGQRLWDLGVMRDMRVDAVLPDGNKMSVEGFLTVDETKMQELDDATVGSLHRDGVLGLVHAHWQSLAHLRRLFDWHMSRALQAGKTLATAAAPTTTAH